MGGPGRDDAPLLIYGPYGRRSYHSRATKVFCSGEPFALPLRLGFDYALSWHPRDDDHHVRVPLGIWNLLQHPGDADAAFASRAFDEWAERPHFCNFIYSNARARERREFFATLSQRRFVHSPGVVETNTSPVPGGRSAYDWWRQKIDYRRQFRFTIAFENIALPGYTSEKLVDALLTGTVPIYWGNPDVSLDVDPRSFVNAATFASWEKLAEYVVQLDDNRGLARPFFEHPQPLLIDLDQTKAAVAALLDRARIDSGSARRVRRAVRPWIIEAARARKLRQGSSPRLAHPLKVPP